MQIVGVLSMFLLILAVMLSFPLACAIISQRRNRNPIGWFIAGLFTPLAMVILLLIEPRPAPVSGAATSRPLWKSSPFLILVSLWGVGFGSLLALYVAEQLFNG